LTAADLEPQNLLTTDTPGFDNILDDEFPDYLYSHALPVVYTNSNAHIVSKIFTLLVLCKVDSYFYGDLLLIYLLV
jgi:hypothetical protein